MTHPKSHNLKTADKNFNSSLSAQNLSPWPVGHGMLGACQHCNSGFQSLPTYPFSFLFQTNSLKAEAWMNECKVLIADCSKCEVQISQNSIQGFWSAKTPFWLWEVTVIMKNTPGSQHCWVGFIPIGLEICCAFWVLIQHVWNLIYSSWIWGLEVSEEG